MKNMKSELEIYKIDNINTIVIKKISGRPFLSTQNSIIISIPTLAMLIKFLIRNRLMSKKVLEGILSELNE